MLVLVFFFFLWGGGGELVYCIFFFWNGGFFLEWGFYCQSATVSFRQLPKGFSANTTMTLNLQSTIQCADVLTCVL